MTDKQQVKSVSTERNKSYLTQAYCVSEKDAIGLEQGVGGSFPFRPNCFIEPLITGKATLGKLADLIEAAESSIDILVWGFDPSLRLKRTGKHDHDKDYRLGTMLEKQAVKGIKVRVRCYLAVGVAIRVLNTAGIPSAIYDSFTYDNVVDELNNTETTFAYVSIWNVFQQGGKLQIDYEEMLGPETVNSPFFKKLEEYHNRQMKKSWDDYTQQLSLKEKIVSNLLPPKIHFLKWLDKNPPTSSSDILPEAQFISEWALEYTSSPHQKMVLIDYEVPKNKPHKPCALVMGNNLKAVDWDTAEHLYENSLRDDVPRQDVACFVKGPILNDLNANFEEVYNNLASTQSKLARSKLPASITNKSEYKHALQLCRTYIPKGETAIHHLYANAISQIDEYAYFENQYFRHDKLVDKLMERMNYLKGCGSDKVPHIFLVIEPAGDAARGTTEETMAQIGKGPEWDEIKKKLDAEKIIELEALGAKISLCSLATHSKLGHVWEEDRENILPTINSMGVYPLKKVSRRKYKGINIHTKVLITDDVFFTIGSANFNYRSMMADNELNVACHDESEAKKLRDNLMGMHMGTQYSGALNIEKLFKRWERLIIKNDKIIENKTSPLKSGSHIVSYEDSGAFDLRLD